LEGTLEHENLHAGLSAMYITRLYFGKFEKHISELPRKVLFSFLKCDSLLLISQNKVYLPPEDNKRLQQALHQIPFAFHHHHLYTCSAIFTILAQDSKADGGNLNIH